MVCVTADNKLPNQLYPIPARTTRRKLFFHNTILATAFVVAPSYLGTLERIRLLHAIANVSLSFVYCGTCSERIYEQVVPTLVVLRRRPNSLGSTRCKDFLLSNVHDSQVYLYLTSEGRLSVLINIITRDENCPRPMDTRFTRRKSSTYRIKRYFGLSSCEKIGDALSRINTRAQYLRINVILQRYFCSVRYFVLNILVDSRHFDAALGKLLKIYSHELPLQNYECIQVRIDRQCTYDLFEF